jgi:acetyl esterase
MSVVLDPATGMFLAGMREAGGKPLYEQTVDEIRAGIAMASQQLAAPPADVHDIASRRIPVARGEIGVRIYTPRPLDAGERLPIVLQYHGGGFIAGDLDTHDSICRYYSRHADLIVVSVDYRLAPEHRFPVAVEDAYAACVWAVEHAGEIGGDARRVALTGDSAGGNLAAVVCQLAKERGGPAIALQVLVYPTVDFDLSTPYDSRVQFGGGQYFLGSRDMELFQSLYLTDAATQARDPRASPLVGRNLAGLPPAVIVTAGCDPLCDEGKAYAARLAAAGVPVESRCFEGTIHAFMSFAGAIPAGLEALAHVAERMRAALHQSQA